MSSTAGSSRDTSTETPGVVLAHGPDHNLSADEIGGIQLIEEAVSAEA